MPILSAHDGTKQFHKLGFPQVLRRASEGVFVPLTVGGGIRGFTDAEGRQHSALDVAAEYFRSGADKVSIGSDAVDAALEYMRIGEKTGKTAIEQISWVSPELMRDWRKGRILQVMLPSWAITESPGTVVLLWLRSQPPSECMCACRLTALRQWWCQSTPGECMWQIPPPRSDPPSRQSISVPMASSIAGKHCTSVQNACCAAMTAA